MTIKTGTRHFLSAHDALMYYRHTAGQPDMTRLQIDAMSACGIIAIGPPSLPHPLDGLYPDRDGRYFIVSMELSDDWQSRFKIVRERPGRSLRTVKKGLSLAQAQAHCLDPQTRGTDERGYFVDRYQKE